MASSAARTMCARPVPRVMPTMVPRLYMSQYGAPSPVNAGTRNTPAVSGTLSAICSLSAAFLISFISSRSHCTVAPPMNTLPSSAKVGLPSSRHAMVVSSPFWLSTGTSPVFISMKQPVP